MKQKVKGYQLIQSYDSKTEILFAVDDKGTIWSREALRPNSEFAGKWIKTDLNQIPQMAEFIGRYTINL